MSGTLLLIAAVWLILLAPLLLRDQKPIRRTAQALAETRVLHRGGSAVRSRPKLKPSVPLYQVDDADRELELVDAEPEYVLFDDASVNTGKGVSSDIAAPVTKVDDRSGDAGMAEADMVDAEAVADAEVLDGEVLNSDVVDGDVVEGEVVDAGSATVKTAETVGASANPADVTGSAGSADSAESTDSANSADSGADSETGEFEPVQQVQADSLPSFVAAVSPEQEIKTKEIDNAYFRGGDLSNKVQTRDTMEYSTALALSQSDLDTSAEVNEDDIAYVNARRGRGIYDPVASQRLAQQRLKRRQQVLMVLASLCGLSILAGVFVGGAAWFAVAISVGFTLFYLFALRRQVLEERRTRARRLARMRRARLGVHNTEDEELGVPSRLMRPGAVIVESDDVDPEFEHLDYVDSREIFDSAIFEDSVDNTNEHTDHFRDLRAV